MAPSDDDTEEELSRWQLPLRPLDKPLSSGGAPTRSEPVLPPITLNRTPAPEAAPEPKPKAKPKRVERERLDPGTALETPDITARFVVAQLAELNERIASLTEATAERTVEAIEEVQAGLDQMRGEVARLTSLRELDVTEQAAGIFGAVEAGSAALDRFATIVNEVTSDLRLILNDTLSTIGGTDGLAEAVVQGATDLAETRSELMAGISRIQRDLATLRKRIPVQSKTSPAVATAAVSAQVSDEQVAYIVEAVTEAVVAALVNPARPSRRKAGA